MKRIIRNGVFETNSSSTHALSRKNVKLFESNLPVSEDGYIHVSLGSFDHEAEYGSQMDKLVYVLTHIFNDNYYTDTNNFFEQCHEFRYLNETIINHTKAKGLKIDSPYYYLDHGVIGCLHQIVDIYNEQSILNFIFDDDVVLKIEWD